jgi:hypothetical protein
MLNVALSLVGILVGLLGLWMASRSRRDVLRRNLVVPRVVLGEGIRSVFRTTSPLQEVIQALFSTTAEYSKVRPAKKRKKRRKRKAMQKKGRRSSYLENIVASLIVRSLFRRVPRTSLPGWASVLLGPTDAERYRKEWGAHLWELIAEGDLRQARHDRRRLIRTIFWLALAIRVRRIFTRARAR